MQGSRHYSNLYSITPCDLQGRVGWEGDSRGKGYVFYIYIYIYIYI